jgi:hypothetical protein
MKGQESDSEWHNDLGCSRNRECDSGGTLIEAGSIGMFEVEVRLLSNSPLLALLTTLVFHSVHRKPAAGPFSVLRIQSIIEDLPAAQHVLHGERTARAPEMQEAP